jgi:hypothetical protein
VISGVVITASGRHKPVVIVVITAGSRTPPIIFWLSEPRTDSKGSSLPVVLISAVMWLALMTESVVVVDQDTIEGVSDFRSIVIL